MITGIDESRCKLIPIWWSFLVVSMFGIIGNGEYIHGWLTWGQLTAPQINKPENFGDQFCGHAFLVAVGRSGSTTKVSMPLLLISEFAGWAHGSSTGYLSYPNSVVRILGWLITFNYSQRTGRIRGLKFLLYRDSINFGRYLWTQKWNAQTQPLGQWSTSWLQTPSKQPAHHRVCHTPFSHWFRTGHLTSEYHRPWAWSAHQI